MIRLWDEIGVKVYPIGEPDPGRRTIVYRGCEIVYIMPGEWQVWYLAISGREGRIGEARTEAGARRLVDECWEMGDED